MRPRVTIWEPEQHSAGKHLILQRYLDAWIPIIGRSYQRVILVDGFAGPGRYTNGERGSPMIMLDAYRLRKDVATLRAQFSFLFIENRGSCSRAREGGEPRTAFAAEGNRRGCWSRRLR